MFDKLEENVAPETSIYDGTYLVQLVLTSLGIEYTGLVAIVEQMAGRNEAITT